MTVSRHFHSACGLADVVAIGSRTRAPRSHAAPSDPIYRLVDDEIGGRTQRHRSSQPVIMVHASLCVRDDLRDEFLQFMTRYVHRTRMEPGNIRFELTARLDEPATFTMVECWRDEDAVRDHFAQDYVREFRNSRVRFELDITGTVVLGGRVEPMHEWLRRVLTTSAADGAQPSA